MLVSWWSARRHALRLRPLAVGLALMFIASCASARSGLEPTPIQRALVLFVGGDAPPPDDAPWQPRLLPDDWSRTRPDSSGDAWYRIDVARTANDTGLMVIYVPRVNMAGVPYVNGVQLASHARLTEPISRLWYRPQLHWVPGALLRPGRNVIHYRMRSYPRTQGGFSEVYFGRPNVIVPLWSSHHFWQVTAMQATTSITAALAVLALVAWGVLRTQPSYGYFGLAALSWTLHGSLVLSTEIVAGLAVRDWETLIHTSLVWVVVALMMFALRLAGLRRPLAEGAVLAFGFLDPVLVWASPELWFYNAVDASLLVLIIVGAIEFKILVDVARRTRSIESILLVSAALLVLGLGVHDLLNRRGASAFAEPFNLHFGVPVLFATVFWNLLGQITAAKRATERLNADLELRVAEKTSELESSYAQLRRADAAEARVSERERIMRDMHDGVGSQLIAARQLAERGQLGVADVAALLDECIDDLRLMIDSLEPSQGDLVTVLGNLRYRLTDRLSRQGLVLQWEISDLPLMPHLTPTDILHVLRIVQEAFANVLKHAHASEVAFSAAPSADARYVVLSVRDNGRGPSSGDEIVRGRGIANMVQRASALGGTFQLESKLGSGCEASLALPVQHRMEVRAS
jgi:signal transduction histidine kinase